VRIRPQQFEDAPRVRIVRVSRLLTGAAERWLFIGGIITTTLYLATAWLATRASSADPTVAQMQGLRRQVAATLASMPTMARASNAVKQEWAEANLIQATFASMAANEAARNPAYAAKARPAMARGVMALYRIDLLRMNLTNQGLRSAT
jgi:hypothetical protein